MTRGQAIAAKCRECIHDPHAAGTWREQVAVCACTVCTLWQYRPLSRNAPAWIASRSPDDLPNGFASLIHDEAVATLRGNMDASPDSAPVRAHRGTCGQGGATHVAGKRARPEMRPYSITGQ